MIIALIVAGFVVAAIAWFLAAPRRLVLILILVAAGIAVVVLVGAGIIGASMSVSYSPRS